MEITVKEGEESAIRTRPKSFDIIPKNIHAVQQDTRSFLMTEFIRHIR